MIYKQKINYIQKWENKFFNESARIRTLEVVSRIEAQTECEVVPVVVKSSTPLGHLPLVFAIVFAFVVYFLEVSYFQFTQNELLNYLFLPVTFILSFALMNLLFFCFPIRAWFWSQAVERYWVWTAAEMEFYRQKLHMCRGGNGVLLFLSLDERKVLVLTGEGIHKQLAPDFLKMRINEMIPLLKKEKFAEAIIATLEVLEIELKRLAPKLEDDATNIKASGKSNQFENRLQIKWDYFE